MLKKILIGAAIIGCGAFGILLGFIGATLINFDVKNFSNVARFIGTMQFIRSQYVEEVDEDTLINGAISGMMRSLGDPHSLYLDQKFYSQLKAETNGSFGGIGVYMGFRDDGVYVLGVIPESPGEKVGLLTGDTILAVNSQPVSEIEPGEVVLKIRGEVGTSVDLLIHREGEEDKVYTITRDIIKVKTVSGRMLDDREGYMKISHFSENTGKEFRTTLNELEEKGLKGLILDLRQNPGGVITSCLEIAQQIVPEGPIVSVVKRDGDKEVFTSPLKEPRFPIVVLIDKNSASASELLSGALQDTKAALVVGKTSYGKGSVQTVIPMLRDDGIKLTIARYYTPNGRNIDGTGITPDVDVDLEIPLQSSGEIDAASFNDNQLAVAEEILTKQLDAGKILFDKEDLQIATDTEILKDSSDGKILIDDNG